MLEKWQNIEIYFLYINRNGFKHTPLVEIFLSFATNEAITGIEKQVKGSWWTDQDSTGQVSQITHDGLSKESKKVSNWSIGNISSAYDPVLSSLTVGNAPSHLLSSFDLSRKNIADRQTNPFKDSREYKTRNEGTEPEYPVR